MDDIKRPTEKSDVVERGGALAWEAPEFKYFEKTAGWFTGSIVIAVLMGIFAIWQANFLFLIFIVIAEALVLFWGKQPPRTLTYRLTKDGIEQGEVVFYPFSTYDAFSIIYDDHLAELILRPRRPLLPLTKILLPVALREELAEKLSAYIPAYDYEESFFEHMVNRLRL